MNETPILATGRKPVRSPQSLKDITGNQWRSGIAAWLGWLFDGLDSHLYTLVATPFVAYLLQADKGADIVREKSAWIQASFLVGWALGGSFFGRVGDILGRSRTLSLTILTYALFTGLAFFATNWWMLLIFRFLAALGIGGEWAIGASLLSESWPKKWQVWVSAVLQTGINIGVLLACLVNFLLAFVAYKLPGNPERYVFLVGILPAFIVLWIRSSVKESEEWHAARASAGKPPPWTALFKGRVLKTTVLTSLVCCFALTAWWAFLFWNVQYIGKLPELRTWSPEDVGKLKSTAFFLVIGASIPGNFFAALIAKFLGYRKAIAVMCLGFTISLALSYGVVRDYKSIMMCIPFVGFFSGVFGLFTMYLPPLFPVLLRTTGAGFCFNIGRIAAAAGTLIFGLFTTIDIRIGLFCDAFLFIPAMLIVLLIPNEEPEEPAPETSR